MVGIGGACSECPSNQHTMTDTVSSCQVILPTIATIDMARGHNSMQVIMLAKGHYMPLPTISAINMAKDLNSLQVINSLHSHELTKITFLNQQHYW